MPSRRSLVFKTLFAVVLLVGALAAALPWWWPRVALPLAARRGITVGAWQSHGWSGVEFKDVVMVSGATRVAIGSVRAPALLTWPRGDGPEPDVVVTALEVGPSGAAASAPTVRSPVTAAVGDVLRLWPSLKAWLPPARVDGLALVTGGRRHELAQAQWTGEALVLEGRIPWRDTTVVARLEQAGDAGLDLAVDFPGAGAALRLDVRHRRTGVELSGSGSFQGRPITIIAHYGRNGGWAPRAAVVEAPEMEIDPHLLGLSGYGPVRGRVAAAWDRGRAHLELTAQAEPAVADTAHPPLAIKLRGAGDLDALRIESLRVTIPGFGANLSQPLEIEWGTWRPRTAAAFSVEGDLAVVPALGARGRVAGEASVEIPDDGAPVVRFNGTAGDVNWRSIEAGTMALAGRWVAPVLEVERLDLGFADGGWLKAAGAFDTATGVIGSAEIEAHVAASNVRAWIADPGLRAIDLRARASGPWKTPTHEGSLEVARGAGDGSPPTAAAITWSGSGEAVTVTLGADVGAGARFAATAALEHEADGAWVARWSEAQWTDADGVWWRLARPAAVRVRLPVAGEGVVVAVEGLELAGEGLSVAVEADVRWPAQGRVDIRASGLDAARLGAVVPAAARAVRIGAVNLRAAWDRGPVALEGDLSASYSPEIDVTYTATARFQTEEGDLAFGSVEVLDKTGVVLTGAGRLPLRLAGGADGFSVAVPEDGAISLELGSRENPAFWASIAALTGWALEQPELSGRLEGTLRAPRGEVVLAAAKVRPPAELVEGLSHLPELSGLYIKLIATDAGLELPLGMVAIDEHWVTLKGGAPWPVWQEWREKKRVAWELATFDLASNPLPIAIASRVFPTLLAPAGDVSINIRHAPGDGFGGRLWLHGASLRPLGDVGAVRDIHSEIDLEGNALKLTRMDGLLGGQRVRIAGDADISDLAQPAFDLRVTSSRVPLVRRQGLIVRAELDLTLKQARGAPAHVSGRIDFGPSVYVSDLVALVPGGQVDTPEARPPYFSVRERPFADWTLDVAVHGESFLRVETPLFRGTIATDLTLRGTLGQPQAVGWIWGTEGVVLFPFARMPLDQLEVTLSAENPYMPTLLVTGSTRAFGYDVRVEVSGTAADPRLLFSSDPPLSSQDVFLMVTTGTMPAEGQALSGSSRAGRLALFLGQNLVSGLGLGDDRLTVRSGDNFSREGRETIHVQYELGGRWALVGEYDRFDAFNGGIKFRLVDR